MEKPLITTDAVGCREVVEEGVNGLLVPVKDATALAHDHDPDAERPCHAGAYGQGRTKENGARF